MYILYNNDGSINKFDLSDFIQKGNDGVNSIFLAVKGYDYLQWTAAVFFTLPNDQVEVITPLAGEKEIDGTQYSGWFVIIPASVTAYVGNVKFSVQILNPQDQVLFTYEGKLIINPSSIIPDDTRITLSQYNALLQLVIQTPTALTTIKVLNNPLVEDLSAYNEGQIFLSRSDGKFYILQGGIIRLFALDYVTSDALNQALSGYVTSQALSTALSSYVTTTALNSTLSSYVTSTNLTSILASYVTSQSLTSILTGYITTNNLDTKLNEYVKTSVLNSTLADYVTNTSLGSTLASYVTTTSLTSTLNNYVTSSGLTSILSGYVTSTYLSTVLAGYLTSSDLNGYATEAFVNSALSNYITSSDLSTALNDYATQTWVNNNLSSYVTSTALSNTLANYVTSTQMQSAIATALSSALQYKGKASVSTLNGYGTSSSNGSLYVLTDAGTLTQGNVSVIAGDQVAWNSSTSEWDKLAAAIDTSNFVTTSDLNTALGDYVLTTALSSALANYVTSTALSSALASYVTSTSLSSTLANYITTTALNNALSSYVTTTALNTALSDYATTSDLNTAIADFITSSDLTSALASYVTSTDLASTLASYVTSTSLATTLSNYVTAVGLASTLSSYVTATDLNTALASYVTNTTLTSTLSGYVQTEAGKGLSSNDYTTEDQTKLAGIESGAQVNVLEGISINGVTLPISGKIASITGLATTTYIDGKINKLEEIDVSSLTVYQFINTYGLGTAIKGKITSTYSGTNHSGIITSASRILYSTTYYTTITVQFANYTWMWTVTHTGPWTGNPSALNITLTQIANRADGSSTSIGGTLYITKDTDYLIYRHKIVLSGSMISNYFECRTTTADFVTSNNLDWYWTGLNSSTITLEFESHSSVPVTSLSGLYNMQDTSGTKLLNIQFSDEDVIDTKTFNPVFHINKSGSTYKIGIMYSHIISDRSIDAGYGCIRTQSLYYKGYSVNNMFSDTVTRLGSLVTYTEK